jgi:putative copper resistance protein D
MLLSSALEPAGDAWTRVAVVGALRFSSIGILSVLTLMATGVVNTWNLAGSASALAETEYGELLSLKMVLFVVMVGIAAVNRLQLLPRLAGTKTTRQLRRNVVLEMALATVIIFIVGALGTMPPGGHLQSEPHIH